MKLIFISLVTSVFFISCLNPVYFSIDVSNGTTKVKSKFTTGNIVQSFYSIPWHGGSVFIYNDFSFEGRLILSLDESYVYYKGSKSKLNFMGKDINKDTIQID